MKTFTQQNLESILARISGTSALYCPVKQYAAGTAEYALNFDKWEPGAEVDLSHDQTVAPPKGFFFRPYEALYSAEVLPEISITPERLPSEPLVLFGVHACDLRGLELLDGVFLDEPVDSFYKARRDAATIVALGCRESGAACFCETFGIDRQNPGGDVQVSQHGDCFAWVALTEKGAKLTETVDDLLEDAERPKQAAPPQENATQAKHPLPPHDNLLKIFSSEKWEDLYKTCIACGTCTFLCPTCQCYDITDYDTGKKIKCHRAWDSCMNEDFTNMAHGNPRASHKERFRQRFMHKLVYHFESSGKYGCTGCGRCTAKCPVSLSILKVIKALGE